MKKKLLGNVGVDSGQLLITDPCYVDSEWKEVPFEEVTSEYEQRNKGKYSYAGCCVTTLSPEKGGSLHFAAGHEGAGVAFASGYGDGFYPVYGFYNEDGRIVKIEIDMST